MSVTQQLSLPCLPTNPCLQVVDHWAFTTVFMLLIIGNTVLLAMATAGERAGQGQVGLGADWPGCSATSGYT